MFIPIRFNTSTAPIIEPSSYLHYLLPIFCHQGDKSELWGATPDFLPQHISAPNPVLDCLPINFTVRSELTFFHLNLHYFKRKDSSFLPYGYFNQRLSLYQDFSCFKAERIIGFPCDYISCHTDILQAYPPTGSVYCCARKFCAFCSGNSWHHAFPLAVSTFRQHITMLPPSDLKSILIRPGGNYCVSRSADTLCSPR